MRYLYSFSLILLLGFNNMLSAQQKHLKLFSPDNQIVVDLSLTHQRLAYKILYHQKVVIDTSLLGMSVNKADFSEAKGLAIIKKGTINQSYPWRGVHSTAVNHCNTALLKVTGPTEAKSFSVDFHVFNNGVAFRYIIPGKGGREVDEDNTTFTLPAASIIWSQGDTHAYEGVYKKQLVDTVGEGEPIGPPLTVKLPDGTGYAAITEGGLIDFAGMSLTSAGKNTFNARLSGTVNLEDTIRSPWRIIEIGADLNTLVNCDIIYDVSPPADKTLFPDGFNTSWVQPGKSAWSWLSGIRSVTFGNMKKFIKEAGELGFKYNLIDDGWYKWRQGNKNQWDLLKELVQYADSQHVKIWVWKAYPDRNGIPGLKDSTARKAFLEKCKETGIAGIKIDFFDAENQEVIQFYQDALRDAAKLHLMLDFHGADKPTGQVRTWPNEMTREGIRGMENKSDWPVHNTTLPFTRFLAGHADYTPLSFRSIVEGTTWAHQVASMVVFTSSFMCLAVNPETLLNNPCKNMVQSIPVTWDETLVLPQSQIGELAIFARRKGKVWFLAAMNGEQARETKIPLTFLKSGQHVINVLEDGDSSKQAVKVFSGRVDKRDSLSIQMPSGGGFVARLSE